MGSWLQCSASLFRENGQDDLAGTNAHRYGPSTGNQRIECWWSHSRHCRMTWWINFFKDLADEGTINMANPLDSECLWFSFNELIQTDLEFVKIHWNTHYIRRSRHETVPGRPDELFFVPERFGAVNQLQPVTSAQTDELLTECDPGASPSDYQEYFAYLFRQMNLTKPGTWREALSLFHQLRAVAE